jgi:ABC-type dipeptide/oligopeptide/nickel transport system ATPase component
LIRLIFYFDQSSDPSFHSWISPTRRIKRNISIAVMALGVFSILGRSGMGKSRTISTSNTMKIIARRKNRIENGIRAVFFGSNPHSNADDFSRSLFVRIFRNHESKNVRIATADAIIASVSGRIIIRKLKIFL